MSSKTNQHFSLSAHQQIILAFSGGLDTSFCAIHLAKEKGYEIHAVTIDTGGFSKE